MMKALCIMQGVFFFGLIDENFGLGYNFFGFGGQNYGL
jgi:hypothetical protein